MKTTETKLTLKYYNQLVEQLNEVEKKIRIATCDLIKACNSEGIITFDDCTTYPTYRDDVGEYTESIIAIKAYNSEIRIKTQSDCEFFDPFVYGRLDYEGLWRIILNNVPIVMNN
jgi:hypothetical protein